MACIKVASLVLQFSASNYCRYMFSFEKSDFTAKVIVKAFSVAVKTFSVAGLYMQKGGL